MAASLLERQLATYSGYHRDVRNRATHFIGIPAIIFSLLVLLAQWRFLLVGHEVSIAWIVATSAVVGWIALDRTIGIAMIVPTAALLLTAESVARGFSPLATWTVFAIFFAGGWAFQLVGHLWEGKKPALLDNLFQAFIGPMFIMAEVLVAMGFKPELRSIVEGSRNDA